MDKTILTKDASSSGQTKQHDGGSNSSEMKISQDSAPIIPLVKDGIPPHS